MTNLAQISGSDDTHLVIPTYDPKALQQVTVEKQVDLFLRDVLEKNPKVEYSQFSYPVNFLMQQNGLDQTLSEWIHHEATRLISYEYGLNITDSSANKKAQSSRLSSQLFLGVVGGGAFSFWLPTAGAILVNVVAFPISALTIAVVMGMYFGQKPKYAKHIDLVSRVYGKLIYEAVTNPTLAQQQASAYIEQKRIRQAI